LLRPDLVDELGQWGRQGLEERVCIHRPQGYPNPVLRFGLHVMPEPVTAPCVRNDNKLAYGPVVICNMSHKGVS